MASALLLATSGVPSEKKRILLKGVNLVLICAQLGLTTAYAYILLQPGSHECATKVESFEAKYQFLLAVFAIKIAAILLFGVLAVVIFAGQRFGGLK